MSAKKDLFDEGYRLTDDLVKAWNSQPNPPKVYINNYRIHHGFVGVCCVAGGIMGMIASDFSDDKKTRSAISGLSEFVSGIGLRLMEDDRKDAPNWFNFEKNDSAYNPSQNYTDYTGFA